MCRACWLCCLRCGSSPNAPQGVIRFAAPLSRGTGSIGLNLLTSRVDQPAALAARLTREATFQGPFPLKQGGVGLVLRQPAFGPKRRFAGLVSAVFDWERILSNLKQYAAEAHTRLALEIEDSVGSRYGSSPDRLEGPDVLEQRVPLLDGVLTIQQQPRPRPLGEALLDLLAAAGLSAAMAGSVGWLQHQRRRQALLATALEQQETRFSEFFEAHQGPVFWLDAAAANPAGQALLPVLAAPDQPFAQLLAAKDLQAEALAPVIEADLNACRQCGSHVGEWLLQRRGELQPRRWRVSATQVEQQHLLLLVDDITAQWQQQQRSQLQALQFQAVFEQSSDALALLSPDGVIQPGLVNAASVRLFGVDSAAAFAALTPEHLSPER